MRMLYVVIGLLLLSGTLSAVEVKKQENLRNRGPSMADVNGINADSLLEQADSLFQAREYDQATDVYSRTVEVAQAEFNRPVVTEALAQLARLSLIKGNKEAGRTFLEQAAAKASDSDPMGWSRYLGVRGRYEWKDDDLTQARKTFDDMYVYCNTNALWGRAVDAANMIAIVAETPEEQIEWSRRGIETAEAGGVESWLGPLWNNLGATLYDNKKFSEALEAFIKAREYHWQFSNESAKLYADYHVGMAYRAVGQLDQAAQWLRPVLAWAERLGDHSAIGQACEDLGEIEITRGNRDQGLGLLKRARDEYRAAGFDQSWKEVWDSINQRIATVSGE